MTECGTIASKARLRDLPLLKLHPADAPSVDVLADLGSRFGSHSTVFEQPTTHAQDMFRENHQATKAKLLSDTRGAALQYEDTARAIARNTR